MRIRLNHNRLLEILAASKLSQNHWAMKLGLSRGHWSGIVNGKHPYPSKKTRDLLLEAFGVAFEDLFLHESSSGVDADFQAAIADRYLLDKELGHGGMGTVYLARDIKHGRLVALKVVSEEAVSGIGADRFLKEIRYTARLEHPHILPLYDSGEAAGQPYYVMPYVRAGSLRDRLNRDGQLSVAEAIAMADDVARALAHAHEHQIVHCDVKPENVLLAEDHAYVADFGISRAIHSEIFEWGARREIDASAGTPAYVSPEQAAGEQHLDATADVYSLGCMVFEMLCGEKPFEGTSTREIVTKRFREGLPDLKVRNPDLTNAVCAAVARAMAIDRKDRTPTAKEFVAELSRGAERHTSAFGVVGSHIAGSASMLARLASRRGKRIRRGTLMDSMRQDLTYSLRRLKKSPGFTLAAVTILAMGIGGNSAMFTMLRHAILADPPYPEPDRLVLPAISHVYPTYTYHGASYPEFELMRDVPDRLLNPLAGYSLQAVTIAGAGDAERIDAEVVTPEYFALLGATTMLGRTFTSMDGDKNSPSLVAILSEGLWSSRFGRAPDVVGREISVNGNTVAVVGVLPGRFAGVTGKARIWLPMAAAGVLLDQWRVYNSGSHWFALLGRMLPGIDREAAAAQLSPVALEIRNSWPSHGSGGDLEATVRPFSDVARNQTAQMSLLLLSVGAALVLLIICANLAGLLLARATARARETAIRLAIGAGRWRVARLCLIESLLVSVVGGLIGLMIAFWGVSALASLAPESWIVGDNDLQFFDLVMARVDWGVALFTLGLSVATGLLFGMLPAMRLSAPKQLEDLTSPPGGTGTRRMIDIRSLLVSGQVALAVILVISANLMALSMAALHSVDTGVDESNLLTFSYTLPRSAESTGPHFTLSDADAAQAMAFQERFLEQIKSVPGVYAATSGCPPLGGRCGSSQVRAIDGRPSIPESEWLEVGALVVEDSYFEVVGARIIEGRQFSATDWREASQALILNEAAANELFPNESALGQRLSLGHSVMPEGSMAEVVGVASNILYGSPETGLRPIVYLSTRQVPVENPTFIIRTAGDPYSVLPAIRAELRDLHNGIPIHRVSTVEALGDKAMSNTRLVMAVLSVFAAFATVLAVFGIYAVIAYAVSQRSREIGIRVALGAPASGLLRSVLRQGLLTAGVGVLVGVAAAWGLTWLLSSLLFEVKAADPASFGISAGLLFTATMFASYLPARRVTGIDPIEVLRID